MCARKPATCRTSSQLLRTASVQHTHPQGGHQLGCRDAGRPPLCLSLLALQLLYPRCAACYTMVLAVACSICDDESSLSPQCLPTRVPFARKHTFLPTGLGLFTEVCGHHLSVVGHCYLCLCGWTLLFVSCAAQVSSAHRGTGHGRHTNITSCSLFFNTNVSPQHQCIPSTQGYVLFSNGNLKTLYQKVPPPCTAGVYIAGNTVCAQCTTQCQQRNMCLFQPMCLFLFGSGAVD